MTNFDDSLESTYFEPPRMSWSAWLLLVASAAGAIGYSVYLSDYVVAATVGVVLITAMMGYRMGLSRVVASLGALTVAFMYAPQLGITYENHFFEWFGTTGLLNRIIAISAIGFGIAMLATIVLSMITTRILRSRPRLARLNCWLGFTVGAAEGGLAVLLFLGGLLMVEPMQLQLANADAAAGDSARPVASQQMTEVILKVADQTHSSRLGPVIEENNPFEKFEPLKRFDEIQKSVRVLSDPQKINDLLHHPAINNLQERPEIKEAVANLMDDPEIREVLQSGASMDRNTAVQLLSHPAVLELIDRPGFLEEAGKIIRESAADVKIQI
ncbi:CvpA family protein [Planctomycetes bacterium K23_9]|uniref:Colicin V production protein n=1 Tax=Stieleria marina TaxID=1930275 RepID=A0A517NVU5_9BACT|nr:Colicin V production protein [Planctomycetes bacterium K23_9]